MVDILTAALFFLGSTGAPLPVPAEAPTAPAPGVQAASVDVTVSGRLVLSDGRPAVGAWLDLIDTAAAADPLGAADPVVAEGQTGDRGGFELRLGAAQGRDLELHASFLGHADLVWSLTPAAQLSESSPFSSNSRARLLELGTSAFSTTGVLSGVLRDSMRRPVSGPVTLRVRGPVPESPLRQRFETLVDVSAESGVFRLPDAPARELTLQASLPFGGWIDAGRTTVASNSVTAAFPTYWGPDLDDCVEVHLVGPAYGPYGDLAPNALSLVDDRNRRRVLNRVLDRPGRWVALVEPGERYALRIDDPRFGRSTLRDIRSGRSWPLELKGVSSAVLNVESASGRPATGALQVATRVLLERGELPQLVRLESERIGEGRYRVDGLLPGSQQLLVWIEGLGRAQVELPELEAGEERHRRLTLEPDGPVPEPSPRGIVSQAVALRRNGQPAANLALGIEPQRGLELDRYTDVRASARTDAGGRARIEAPPGLPLFLRVELGSSGSSGQPLFPPLIGPLQTTEDGLGTLIARWEDVAGQLRVRGRFDKALRDARFEPAREDPTAGGRPIWTETVRVRSSTTGWIDLNLQPGTYRLRPLGAQSATDDTEWIFEWTSAELDRQGRRVL